MQFLKGMDIMMNSHQVNHQQSNGVSTIGIGGANGGLSGAPQNCEDLLTLDAEITELHRENARVESQMMRLKSDINAMETHLTHGERVRKFKLVERQTKNKIFFINLNERNFFFFKLTTYTKEL